MKGKDIIISSGGAASKRGPLKITQGRVVDIIMRVVRDEGLEAARTRFKLMNDLFSTERGWAETATEVYDLFAEEKRRLRAEAMAQDLALRRAGAPSIVMVNSNEAMGIKDQGSLLANNYYADVDSVNTNINNEKPH